MASQALLDLEALRLEAQRISDLHGISFTVHTYDFDYDATVSIRESEQGIELLSDAGFEVSPWYGKRADHLGQRNWTSPRWKIDCIERRTDLHPATVETA